MTPPTPTHFSRVADRYLQGALAPTHIHEAVGFDAYHALESICSAWIIHRGATLARTHVRKLNQFATLANHWPFGRGAVAMVIAVKAMRNGFLYPSTDATGHTRLPEAVVTPTQVRDMTRRVGGVIRAVQSYL
jgi:hypothetical protein